MTLIELAARCEQATAGNRELDQFILNAIGGNPLVPLYELSNPALVVRLMPGAFSTNDYYLPPYTFSLDAALSLLDAYMWTAWELRSRNGLGRYVAEISRINEDKEEDLEVGHARTPALAFCAAALKARAASADTHPEGGDVKQAPSSMGGAVLR